jgi:hypothetical protein
VNAFGLPPVYNKARYHERGNHHGIVTKVASTPEMITSSSMRSVRDLATLLRAAGVPRTIRATGDPGVNQVVDH